MSIFNKKKHNKAYKQCTEEYTSTKKLLDELGSKRLRAFHKEYDPDYIDKLVESVEKHAMSNKHKDDIRKFKDDLSIGSITPEDLDLFDYIDDIYNKKMNEDIIRKGLGDDYV